jgi:chaperonin GroEL
VAIAPINGGTPELLNHGGLIARRTLQLPDRREDVGAMYLRSLLWRMHEHVGDGVATTSVLFQSILDDGMKAIAAGCNAQRFRHHLLEGLDTVLAQLDAATLPVDSQQRLIDVAHTICADEPLARHLGELFWVIGEHGQLEIRSGQSRHLDSDVLEGAYWETSLHSKDALSDQATRRVELARPIVFLSDLELEHPDDLVPLLHQALELDAGSLIIITRKISGPCLGLLAANSHPGFQAIAVRTPETAPEHQAQALRDMEVLTGGRAFRAAAGDRANRVRPEDLGSARRAWADRTHIGFVGPAGDARLWRAHVRELRQAARAADDPDIQAQLSKRIARLSSSSAMLWVSGTTVPIIDARKDVAKRTAAALRVAMRDGLLPGAGVAFLNCRAVLAKQMTLAGDVEARAAYGALLRAMEVPTRTLVTNSGAEPGSILAAIASGPSGHGWDARTGNIGDIVAAGVIDPAAVIRMAIRTAVSGAAQALTIDTVVHHRNPQESIQP